jgi:hypothetical protein
VLKEEGAVLARRAGPAQRGPCAGASRLAYASASATAGGDLRNVTIAFSDTPTVLSGSLQSASGQTTTDYHIVVLPADRAPNDEEEPERMMPHGGSR